MSTRLHRLILAAWLLLAMTVAAAETDGDTWSFRAWQTDEGLPDNSVTGVAQTPDGFLWVATYGGLMRFDGADFAAVQTPGLLKKSLRTMLLDRRGRFWIGIDTGSVLCLDTNAARTFANADGLPTDRIAAMAEDRDGAVWVAYPSALCRIKDGRVTALVLADGWPSGSEAWVTTDAQGELWFSKGGQVGVFRNDRLLPELSLPETSIRMCGAATSGLWICAGSGVLKYAEGHEPELRAQLPAGAAPQTLFEDHAGVLWIGTVADGLFRLSGNHLEKVPTSQQSVDCLAEDREGNLWAGTRGGGLNLIRPSAVDLIGREAGLPFESVASVAEAADGQIWVAGQSGTLARRRNGIWEIMDAKSGWNRDAATCVAADQKGGVWIGSRDRTLSYYHDGVWRTFGREDGLHNGSVHLIFVTAGDDVWVVTGSPSRLQRLHDGRIDEPLSLPGENRTIRAMTESPDGTLWVGTLEGQVLRITNAALIVEPAVVNPDNAPVRALKVAPDGALLIGYAGGGLGRLADGRFIRLTTETGLMDDFVSQLLTDGKGGLWLVGNRGLFRVPLADVAAVADGRSGQLRSVVFGRDEGLPNFQPNAADFPNALCGSDGRLWFATRSGLLTAQPAGVRQNFLPPPVWLERVSVDDQTVALYGGSSPLRTGMTADQLDLSRADATLSIPPQHRKLEFDFAALSFSSPENVRFRYRLDNFDDQWIEAGAQRSAKYPHLAAGRYQFHVTACNNDGVWNETGDTLAFVVRPFFWQTWWFRGLLLGCFTAGVTAIVRYVSFRRLRARMAQLKQEAAVERERARIARDMHDEVGAKLTRLSLLAEMAGANPVLPAAAQDEVKELSDTARETIRSFEEVVWAVNPRNDTLADLVHYLCRYAEDYFEGSPVRCVFDLPPEIPAAVLPTELRRQIFLAAKEAFNNILKHARAGSVRLQLVTGADGFQIVIADDGCGFNPAAPPKRPGGGNGLENMRERLHSAGGRLECQSRPGGGTRLILIAPPAATF